MKNSTITIYFSTLSLVFLCFGCLPDKQTNNKPSDSGDLSEIIKKVKKDTDSSSGGELDNSSPNNSDISDQDRKFLVSVKNRLDEVDGGVWETWNTLDWKEKVKIGRSACQTYGDPLAAIDTLLSSYGNSIKRTPENASKLFAADSILDTGAKIYCPEVRAEGYRTLKRNAQQTFDNQMDDLVKQSNDMRPTCLFNCDNQ